MQLMQAGNGFAAIRSTTQIGRKYAELAAMRADGTLRLSPASSPSAGHSGYFPFATDNYTLVQERTLPCYQAYSSMPQHSRWSSSWSFWA